MAESRCLAAVREDHGYKLCSKLTALSALMLPSEIGAARIRAIQLCIRLLDVTSSINTLDLAKSRARNWNVAVCKQQTHHRFATQTPRSGLDGPDQWPRQSCSSEFHRHL
jgi:hypothetical protein